MDYGLLGMLSKINKSIKEQTEVLKMIAQELIKVNESNVKKEITVEFGTKDLVDKIINQLEGEIDEIIKDKVQELLADNSRTKENCAICSIEEILKYSNPALQLDQEASECLDRLCEALKEHR